MQRSIQVHFILIFGFLLDGIDVFDERTLGPLQTFVRWWRRRNKVCPKVYNKVWFTKTLICISDVIKLWARSSKDPQRTKFASPLNKCLLWIRCPK